MRGGYAGKIGNTLMLPSNMMGRLPRPGA
jgi:hypothetical protein